MEDTLLDDVWTVFHHNVDDQKWTMESYTRIMDVASAEEFWGIYDVIKPYLDNNLFFVMREYVFPCWDDPENITGGCVSVRVPIAHVAKFFEELCVRLLCESLCTTEDVKVNGISCSPKHSCCVVKVWLNNEGDAKCVRFPSGYIGVPMFKSNRDNITQDNIHKERSLASTPHN